MFLFISSFPFAKFRNVIEMAPEVFLAYILIIAWSPAMVQILSVIDA